MSKKKARDEESLLDEQRSSGSIGSTLITTAAAFAGTVVGNGLRLFVEAKAEIAERERQGLANDEGVRLTITGVISNTVAAAALAHAVPRGRALVAFMIGAGLSAATGDMPDRAVMDLFKGEPDGFVPMEEEEDPDGI